MRLIISFLFLLVLNTSVAQQKKELTEQEYLALQNKIRFSINNDFNLGLKYVGEMLQSTNDKHLAFANGAASYLYQLKNDIPKSDQKYALALSYLKKIPESGEKTKVHSYLYNYRGLTEWQRDKIVY